MNIKTETWNGYRIRFVEHGGEWTMFAQDAAVACGFTPILDALDSYERIVEIRHVGGVDFALTNKGNLLYITHFYGDSESILVPYVCCPLSEVFSDERFRNAMVSILRSREISPRQPEITELWLGIYKLVGIEPGTLREEFNSEFAKSRPKKEENLYQGVYFVRSGDGLIKIGCTADLPTRFKALQSAIPTDLEIVAFYRCDNVYEREREFHELFKDKKVKGEWFELSDEDVEMLLVRQPILDDAVNLMTVNESFGMGLSVSRAVYGKCCITGG